MWCQDPVDTSQTLKSTTVNPKNILHSSHPDINLRRTLTNTFGDTSSTHFPTSYRRRISLRMSSIDHVPEQETADAPAEQIAFDGSVGSDTDTGGPLQSESTSKDESDTKHHARSNSVKKPATFKAVSVTKNFLAKAGTPTASAAKTNGDNGNNILYDCRK